jgi:hypothetical protein
MHSFNFSWKTKRVAFSAGMVVVFAVTVFRSSSSLTSARKAFNSPAAPTTRPADVTIEPGPEPPCGQEAIPAYPKLTDPAVVKSWSRPDLGRDWKPPSCTHWNDDGFATLITVTARFAFPDGQGALLRHIGAITELAGLQYWSTTHRQWRTLVADAYALSDSQSGQRRPDFSVNELTPGKSFYFAQTDNLVGKTTYRMNILEVDATRIVFDVENVSTVRYHLIPVFRPSELQTIYFLDRESDNVWRFYSMLREGKNSSRLIAGNQSSSVNRAVAFYRHIVGIPSNQEPPAAR